jgi:hypothetical protein
MSWQILECAGCEAMRAADSYQETVLILSLWTCPLQQEDHVYVASEVNEVNGSSFPLKN